MKDRYEVGQRIGYITIGINGVLTLFKILAAIVANSGAMMADAIHSASDILTTVAVIISFKIARRPEDKEHPYGHEKAEPIGAKIIAVILLLTGLGISFRAIKSIGQGPTSAPGGLALYAALSSIVVKEAMFWYSLIAAKKINSSALEADAWHHRSDAISSIATFIGIGAARIGFPLGDPIAALVVSIMIIKVAYDILKKSINELMDSSASPDTIESLRKNIESVPGVRGIDDIKTRVHGNVIYVDVEILVDKNITISEGHKIAEKVENTIFHNVKGIKAITVHIHPWD